MAGDVGFDPLGLSQIKDVGIDLYWLREVCNIHLTASVSGEFSELKKICDDLYRLS